MRKSYRNKSKRRNGGAATVMPLSYYNPGIAEPSANAGRDLLKAIPPIGVRPRIGGKRHSRKHRQTKRQYKGGFVPSIMEGFSAMVAQYITPIALYAGYRLLTRKQKKSHNKTRRH